MSIDAEGIDSISPRIDERVGAPGRPDQWVALLATRQEVQLDGTFTAADLRDIIKWLEARTAT